MNFFKHALIVALLAGSGSALAEGGSERSKQFWENFRISQEQTHGKKGEEQKVAKE